MTHAHTHSLQGPGQRAKSREQPRPPPKRVPVVTSLSWSSKGQTIAASFGRCVFWCSSLVCVPFSCNYSHGCEKTHNLLALQISQSQTSFLSASTFTQRKKVIKLLLSHRYDVEGWCTDRGALATWNIGREGINQNKPDVMINTDVALMTCAFHPVHPVSVHSACRARA